MVNVLPAHAGLAALDHFDHLGRLASLGCRGDAIRLPSVSTEAEGSAQHQDDVAAQLRDAMVDMIMERHQQLGLRLQPDVEVALRKVPRHLFTGNVPLETAYGLDSVVAKRNERGLQLSTVYASPMIALMLGQAGDLAGKRVLEIGSGGYNAALLSELVGPHGTVTSIDIDQDVVDRAETCLKAAGYEDVRVLCRDGEFGVPEFASFDLVIVTVGAWDIPPAWVEQLAGSGRLVVPLRTAGLTRSWAFERRGDRLESVSHLPCGFVPMQGAGEHKGRGIELNGDQVGLWLDEDQQVDDALLDDALSSPPTEVWSGTVIGKGQPFHDQDLWLATALPGFALLTAKQEAVESGLVNPSWRLGTPAIVDGASLAYRAKMRPIDPEKTVFEFGAYGHGPHGAELADRLTAEIRRWDQRGRPAPRMTIYPARTPHADLADGFTLVKRHTKIVISWADHID